MSRKGARCLSCFLAAFGALSGLWTFNAYAADASGLASISNEFWLGLVFTILFALLNAYVLGLKSGFERRHDEAEKRIASLEFDHKQQASTINMLSERVLREHPTRQETTEHREKVERGMERLNDRLDELFQRIGRT